MMNKNSSARLAFSAVELLTVVTIMAIIATLSAPALVSQVRASQLTQAGNGVADTSAWARQTACSRNAIIALAVSHRIILPLELDLRSDSWKPIGAPVKLPEAVELEVTASGSKTATKYGSLPSSAGDVSLEDCSTLVFLPDGRLDSPDATRKVRVLLTGNSQNYYDIIFNSETSAFRILRP